MQIKLLSGGAANGLVSRLSDRFTAQTGATIDGEFGAVGLMRERVEAGEPVDLIILSRKLVDALAASGHADAKTVTDLGSVATGIAVRKGEPPAACDTPDALRQTLLEADGIYFPDPQKATAGIHFAGVLDALGIAEKVAGRLRPYPNGQTAMAAMGRAPDHRPIGCTQVTEILNTPGVTLSGLLPPEHALATIYTAAILTRATPEHAEAARALIALLTAEDTATARREAGFD